MSTTDLNEIRTLARDFARAELRPHVEQWDHDATLGTHVVEQLAELGFFGMRIAEADGGMGFDDATCVAALEELAWGEPATALVVLAQQVVASGLAEGSDAVRERWLGALADGSVRACYVLDDDSGLLARQQDADPEGNAWSLSGASPFVLHTGDATFALARAVTDDGTAMFAVSLDEGSARFDERVDTLGLRPLRVSPLVLDGAAAVRIDDRAFDAARRTGRLGIAAVALGIAQAALDHAIDYAGQREQFRTKLREFEAIRFKLADMTVRIRAARALLYEAATATDGQAATTAKVFASDVAMHVTTEAVQIFGGYGYMRDYPVEKLMRDAKAMALLQGADERLRLDIAATLYDE